MIAIPSIDDSIPRARALLADGRPVSAFAIYKRLYRSGESAGQALEGLFSILMGARRYSAAARLAPAIAAKSPLTGARVRDLAELSIVERNADGALAILEAARQGAWNGAFDRLQSVAERLKAELAAGDTMAGRRHLAIGGAAFCGSTTLGVLLGSMPGFAFAGETHWLTNMRTPKGLESITGTNVPVMNWPVACRVCKRSCECFNVAFRMALARDKTGWYAKIADRLNTENLVSSDKNFPIIQDHDPLFRFDYILSYKEPVSYLKSRLKQHFRPPQQAGPVTVEWASASLDGWTSNYMRHLKIIRPVGRRVVLNWDRFAAEPHFHLHRLADLLSIPLTPDIMEHIRLGHFIGGNMGVDVPTLLAEPVLHLRESNAPPLPPEIHEVAVTHVAAQRAMRVLGAEYRRDFGLAG